MFNIGSTEVTNDFDPVPRGLYPVYVDSVEWKASKAGPEYLNVKFKIFGDNYGNRVLWNIYNVMNNNETARNIAFADLKKMFTASGMSEDNMSFTTKEQLAAAVKDVRCMVKVDIKTDDYGTKNVIKGYEELDEKTPASDFNASDIPF